MSQGEEFTLPIAKRQRLENGSGDGHQKFRRGSRLFAPYRVGILSLLEGAS
jgi:hypothetical protein